MKIINYNLFVNMSKYFYDINEDNLKEESIDNYKNTFIEYVTRPPTLKDALSQLFIKSGATKDKSEELILKITTDIKQFLETDMEKIKNKYPNITLTDAEIISSYTYEFEKEDNQYCPYRLLNRNLVNDNRKEGINNISKYLYILLYSLRKLTRYYPKEKSKYLYRCIPSNINLNYDQFNKKIVPYIIGNKKNFWGFTSTSPNIQTTYEFLGKNKGNKKGTIFTLTGKVWGYDISVFNICREEEVLLEPERKFLIDEVIPPINDIIHVRCEILDTPLVLDNNLTSDVITIRYLINENDKKVKIFGEQFVQNNRGYFSDKCDILFQEKKI